MRIIVTGGGTGGHLFPGIAFASGMQHRVPGCKVMFIGTKRLLDQQTLVDYDFELKSITCMGLKGMGMVNRIKSMLLLPAAIWEAKGIIKRFAPDLVFGVGGYVTGPVLLAARYCGIPRCIHEQNSVPGLTNKILAKIVDKIFLSIPCQYPFAPGKSVLTGNPVRHEIIAAAAQDKIREKKPVTLLVLGGSQGAHRVNYLVMDAVDRLAIEHAEDLTLIHQTGVADEEAVRNRYEKIGIRSEVKAFFRNMADIYSKADLVISRAGATTLAELAVMGIPALLIPYPFAADDHQKINALHYQNGGAAIMLAESSLSGEELAREINSVVKEPERLQEMAANMRKMGKPEATETIINECLALIKTYNAHAKA